MVGCCSGRWSVFFTAIGWWSMVGCCSGRWSVFSQPLVGVGWILFLGLDIYFTFTFIPDGFAFKYSTKLILPDQDPSGSHIGSLCLEMAGNSNKNADIDSSFTSVPATQELFSSPERLNQMIFS